MDRLSQVKLPAWPEQLPSGSGRMQSFTTFLLDGIRGEMRKAPDFESDWSLGPASIHLIVT